MKVVVCFAADAHRSGSILVTDLRLRGVEVLCEGQTEEQIAEAAAFCPLLSKDFLVDIRCLYDKYWALS